MYFVTLKKICQTVSNLEKDIFFIWRVSSPISTSVVTGISYSNTGKFAEYDQGEVREEPLISTLSPEIVGAEILGTNHNRRQLGLKGFDHRDLCADVEMEIFLKAIIASPESQTETQAE